MNSSVNLFIEKELALQWLFNKRVIERISIFWLNY